MAGLALWGVGLMHGGWKTPEDHFRPLYLNWIANHLSYRIRFDLRVFMGSVSNRMPF